jgi:ABC-2 type transport system ATP-binding protein
MIEIKNLYKSFGKNDVLKSINLNFNPGEIHGIVGENGAGKSTLFNCIGGFETYKGEINYTEGELKDKTGFLPTDSHFLSRLTGQEYLQLFCNARHADTSDLRQKNIFDLPLNRFADTYSTGMKKKLALTAILLQKNDVFILDEPFNGVDIQSNIVIKEIILKLKSLNKIVIISSHIFSTLSETCDFLHHLKDGKIIKSAQKSEFKDIENDMKTTGTASKLDALDL